MPNSRSDLPDGGITIPDDDDPRDGMSWYGIAAILGTTALLIAAVVWLYLSGG